MTLKWATSTDQLYAVSNSSPSLDLDFSANKTLDDNISGNNLITFTRASSGTYVGADGLIRTAATDEARFDHDPVTGESLGLLLEREARTNYCTDYDSPGGWSPTNTASSQTFDAVTAPDGSTITQGFRLPNRTSRVYPTVSSPGTIVPVASIYARAVSGTTTLSLFVQGGIVASDISVPSDRWVRMTGTTTSRTVTAFSVRGNNSQSSDVYLWGAQLEEGSFPTSLIPTSGSTVTRAADVAEITGTNFSSWYNQSEGTLFAKFQTYFVAGSQQVAGFTEGVSNAFRWGIWDNQLYMANSGTQYFSSLTASTSPTKTAFAVSSNDAIGASNGILTAQDTTVVLPVVDNFHIGRTSAGQNILNGHIARLTYFPYRLSDAILQEITS